MDAKFKPFKPTCESPMIKKHMTGLRSGLEMSLLRINTWTRYYLVSLILSLSRIETHGSAVQRRVV